MPDTKTLHYYLAFRRAYFREHIPILLLVGMSFSIPPHNFPIDNIWWIIGTFRTYYYHVECRLCKVNNTTGNIDFENKTYCLDPLSWHYRLEDEDYNNLNILLDSTKCIMVKPIIRR